MGEREGVAVDYYHYNVYRPRVRVPSSKRAKERRRGKNTPSYLVHFYPLKQFQHCFKIVLSRVIVLCMRPRSSGLALVCENT